MASLCAWSAALAFRLRRVDGEDYSEHKVVLGTHTADNEQNMLIVAKVRLPNEDAEIDARKYDEQEGGTARVQMPQARTPSTTLDCLAQSWAAMEALSGRWRR